MTREVLVRYRAAIAGRFRGREVPPLGDFPPETAGQELQTCVRAHLEEVGRVATLNFPRLRPGDAGFLGWTTGKWAWLQVFSNSITNGEHLFPVLRQVSFPMP